VTAVSAPAGKPATELVIIAILFVLVFAIYTQVRAHAFIDFDDPGYVSQNPHVLGGLTSSGIQWAFTHVHQANWHPLTWISHMVDVQLFGPSPGALLMVSVTLHALNSALLFLFLNLATGSKWRSATVAALFAVHPMHVESVAWMSERKDTLSTIFFLLCLVAYTIYVKRGWRPAYGLAIAALALGLMAKPMVVTTPFILLLLDFWPFQRIDRDTARQRLMEKIPFVLAVIPSIAATLFAQRQAMPTMSAVPVLLRFANAAISYVKYLGKTLWPTNLSVLYPFPSRISPSEAAICAAVVLGASVMAYLLRRTFPWIFVGWFWFVGTLIPVIGIVQVGIQSMADRYMYLPHIGLFIAIVWTAAYLLRDLSRARIALPAVAAAIILIFAAIAHAQVRYWKDSVSLFQHAVAVTSNNKFAHLKLGDGLLERGDYEAAEREYRSAEGFKPAANVYRGLALALSGQGKLAAAAEAAKRATEANPNSFDAWANLGYIQLARGNAAQAQDSLTRSLLLKSDPAVSAHLFMARGQLQEASEQFRQAVASHPDDAGVHNDLAAVLARVGEDQRALDEYEIALRLNPNLYDARMNFGALLSRLGRNDAAGQHFAEASRIRPRSPEPRVYLALLEAGQHQFDRAIRDIESAIAIDHDASNTLLINAIRIPSRPTAIDEYLTFLRQQSGHR
jgi:tetratricopeptide (TPR) repeat protein